MDTTAIRPFPPAGLPLACIVDWLHLQGDCDNLVLSSVDTLTQGYFRSIGEWGGPCCGGPSAKPPLATMQHALGQDPASMAFVAHVRNGSHFVLLTSWDTTRGAFAAQDPYYPTAFYRYDEISDVLLYEILPPEGAEVPRPYRVYKQFDYRWGRDTMIYGNTTVAEVGCLMSSTSMALHAHGVQIPTTSRGVVPSDPGSLNEWLKAHHGYVGNNNMEAHLHRFTLIVNLIPMFGSKESSIPALSPARVKWSDKTGMHTTSDIPWPEIKDRRFRPQQKPA